MPHRLLQRIVPAEGGSVDLDSPDARSTLLDWYDPRSPEHLRLNLVSTLDGRAAGSDGTSESLTSRADRTIFGVIRELSDLVLVGAESVRREGYLRPKRAALAIVTASGNLRGNRLDPHGVERSDHPLLVITTDHGAREAAATLPSAQVLVMNGDSAEQLDLADVVSALRRAGFARIAAEGGPRLAAQLLEEGLVDELCLSVMPRLGGPALPLLTSSPLTIHDAQPHTLIVDETGAQFGRWLVPARSQRTRQRAHQR